jgi:tRNA nucleotidyltransferase (CCA-adding enzyme)
MEEILSKIFRKTEKPENENTEKQKNQENRNNFDLEQGKKRLERFIEIISSKSHEKTFGFLSDLQNEFPENEIYLVGGIVRDKILGRGPHPYDADFVIRNIPSENLKNFLSQRGEIELVETANGVFRFVPKDTRAKEPINISVPRTEMSYGPAHANFLFKYDPNLSINKDLLRRDFTINAMAWNIKEKELYDPSSGVVDLKKKFIKTVESPEKTFTEDYSRILRALRFACLLNFEIEEKTWLAIKKYGLNILEERQFGEKKRPIIPWDTIGKEFLKTLMANPEKTLDLYNESGILKIILPEIEALKGKTQESESDLKKNVFVHTKSALHHTLKDASLELKIAVLLHNIEKSTTQIIAKKNKTETIKKICERFRIPKKMRDRICLLIEYYPFLLTGDIFQIKPRLIKKYFIDNSVIGNELLEISRIEILISSTDIKQKESLDKIDEMKKYIEKMRQAFKKTEIKTFTDVISGDDIMKKFGFKRGQKIGEYLEKAEQFILKHITEKQKRPEKEEILKQLENISFT